MTRVTNSDQVLMLLRGHLQRHERARRKRDSRVDRKETRQGPLERVQQLAATAALSETEVRSALISSILIEEFGPALANDPEFQRMVSGVLDAINADAESRQLLDDAAAVLSGNR